MQSIACTSSSSYSKALTVRRLSARPCERPRWPLTVCPSTVKPVSAEKNKNKIPSQGSRVCYGARHRQISGAFSSSWTGRTTVWQFCQVNTSPDSCQEGAVYDIGMSIRQGKNAVPGCQIHPIDGTFAFNDCSLLRTSIN